MGTVANLIVKNTGPTMMLAEAMLKGVNAGDFARKPAGEAGVIDTNHPAFVYGHLAMYPARVMDMLGKPPGDAETPASFAELFAAGKECRDDPDGSIYPPMETITSHFFGGHRALIAAVSETTDEQLGVQNPVEGGFREMCPTIGHVANFLLGSHAMMHLGQMSAWRRCMGLGPAM